MSATMLYHAVGISFSLNRNFFVAILILFYKIFCKGTQKNRFLQQWGGEFF
jgi:hypothetical protein